MMFVPQEHLRAGVVAFMLKTAPSLHEEHLEWEFFLVRRQGQDDCLHPHLNLNSFCSISWRRGQSSSQAEQQQSNLDVIDPIDLLLPDCDNIQLIFSQGRDKDFTNTASSTGRVYQPFENGRKGGHSSHKSLPLSTLKWQTSHKYDLTLFDQLDALCCNPVPFEEPAEELEEEGEMTRNLVRLGSQEWLKRARVGKTAAPISFDLAPSSNLLPCISS